MATQQQGQQLKSSQQREHNRRRPPWKRWLIAGIILVLIAIGTVIWVITDQGSLTTILPIVIFTVLSVVIGLFQWLFPVSSGSTEHTGANIHPSLIAQLSSITSSVATMPQSGVDVSPSNHTQAPQSGPLHKHAFRGIRGVPTPTDPRTIQQREKAVRDVYARLIQPDTAAVVLTGIGGVGKSTLAALIYRYAEEQRRGGNGPFTAEAVWLNIDAAVTFADLAGNLFEVLGKPLPDFANLSLQHHALALLHVFNTADQPRLGILDQFVNPLDLQTRHDLGDRPVHLEWLHASIHHH